MVRIQALKRKLKIKAHDHGHEMSGYRLRFGEHRSECRICGAAIVIKDSDYSLGGCATEVYCLMGRDFKWLSLYTQ